MSSLLYWKADLKDHILQHPFDKIVTQM